MNYPNIPYCGRQECDPTSQECRSCSYFTAYTDSDEPDGYCDYWDIHSPNECPECNGSGYGFDGEQCDRCNGTGEIKRSNTFECYNEIEPIDFCDIF